MWRKHLVGSIRTATVVSSAKEGSRLETNRKECKQVDFAISAVYSEGKLSR